VTAWPGPPAWLFALVLLLLAPLLRAAPDATTEEPAAEAVSPQSSDAPVTVFNRQITVFRAPFLGVSPADRARRTRQALIELLDQGGEGKVTVQQEPQGRVVMIDGHLVMILTPRDADRLRGETLDAAARSAAAALERVIAETRESRDRSRLLHGSVLAGGATAVFALSSWLTLQGYKRLVRWLAATRRSRARRLAAEGLLSFMSDRLFMIAAWLAKAAVWALLALLLYQWLSFVFSQFPYTRPWGEQLDGYLLGVARRLGESALGAVPDLLIAVAIFGIARGIVGLASPLFERAASGREPGRWLDTDTAKPTQRIFGAAVWLFALVMAYPYLPGADSDAFKGISVLIGLMFTVGGSSLFGQAASGLILMYSRTIRVGEYVRINDQEGTVTELGTFTTRIRTGLGEELTLPNALVLGTVTKNYSRTVHGRGYIVDTTVTIGYDTPWRQVEAMLTEAALRTPGVLAQPAPRVFQTALSDFYPEYRLVCQAVPSEPRPRAEVLANLHGNIQDVFNEYGVQIMSPHYLGDPDGPKVVPKKDWYAAPASAGAESAARPPKPPPKR
jgi:small-conductance mechanosensitive channel